MQPVANSQYPVQTRLDQYFAPLRKSTANNVIKKIAISTLNDDTWLHIASYLNFEHLQSFSCVCRLFRVVALEVLPKNARNIERLLQLELARRTWIPRPFKCDTYQHAYNLTLQKVLSCEALKQFPEVRSLKVLDYSVSEKNLINLLGTATHLQSLYVAANTLTRTNLKAIASSPLPPSLVQCRLVDNMASNVLVRALAIQCTQLEELSLHNCTKINFRAFSGTDIFANLKKIELFKLAIPDAQFRFILSCCPKLVSVHFDACRHFSGASLVDYPAINFLEELTLSSTALTSQAFLRIAAQAENLLSLNINYCDIESLAFEEVVYPAKLRRLHADWTEIDDAGLRILLDSTALEELSLKSCTRLTGAVLKERPELKNKLKSSFD